MSTLATIFVFLALIGAAVSWVFGAWNFVCTLRVLSDEKKGSQVWYAIFAWPFAARQMSGDAAVYASNVNKALVAFLTCVMIAAAAFSLSANLSRLPR